MFFIREAVVLATFPNKPYLFSPFPVRTIMNIHLSHDTNWQNTKGNKCDAHYRGFIRSFIELAHCQLVLHVLAFLPSSDTF